jgi:hypothetical protein
LRADREGPAARKLAEQLHHRRSVLFGVERQRLGVAAVFLEAGVLGVFFLKVAGIAQENAAQLDGRPVGIDRIAVAVLHQTRQPAGVVQVRVGENTPINRPRINGKRIPVALLEFAASLKEPAIHQEPLAF